MGLFSNLGSAPAAPAFNAARLAPILEAMDINFATHDDGSLIADWDNCRMYFEATGESDEILGIRAYWDIRPSPEAFDRLVAAANEWNTTRRWPRALVVPPWEDKLPLVAADMVIDLEPGVSDELLRQQVMCFVSTSLDYFEHLEKEFPEHTGWHNMATPEEGTPQA